MDNKYCFKCGNKIFEGFQEDMSHKIEEFLNSPNQTCANCFFKELNLKIDLIKSGEIENVLKDPQWKKSNLIEGLDFYFENGLMVFTEYFHLKKGYCCNNQCRHCPYN